MPPRRKSIPSYLPHKQSGRGRAVWYDPNGVRQQKLLPGPFDSPESRTEFARFQLELETTPAAAVADPDGISLAEVLAAYLEHAERYYVDAHGNSTSEPVNIKRSIKPLRELYGLTPAAAFGPRSLAAVRQRMIDLGWCRSLINQRIDRVKRAFRWAAAEELIPASTYQALRSLPGLRRGRTTAKEREPIRPVAEHIVRATLPFLSAHVRTMIELMMHTGMRPGEACAMTLNQIDRTGKLWVYKPRRHKTAHHGRERSIPFGPNAQVVLTAFLAGRTLAPDAPIFSPRASREECYQRLRAKRKSKVQPSQVTRRKSKPKRVPSERYTTHAITHAVRVAAKKAGVEHWHPYQLRHAHATMVRKLFGLEAAGAALGHTKMSATEVYAERDAELAATVAARVG